VSARVLLPLFCNYPGIGKVAVNYPDRLGGGGGEGHVNFAIGLAGMDPFMDYRGQPDAQSKVMAVTRIAVADEVAAASELVMGKVDRVPVAIARGVRYVPGDGSARELVRERGYDLFR
ncbi:MAG: hypothetical protein F4W93_11920, partial [Dehalococcoidia bacterium]|nr:hypothetical protein [Dehalococcoidia bacterium]